MLLYTFYTYNKLRAWVFKKKINNDISVDFLLFYLFCDRNIFGEKKITVKVKVKLTLKEQSVHFFIYYIRHCFPLCSILNTEQQFHSVLYKCNWLIYSRVILNFLFKVYLIFKNGIYVEDSAENIISNL